MRRMTTARSASGVWLYLSLLFPIILILYIHLSSLSIYPPDNAHAHMHACMHAHTHTHTPNRHMPVNEHKAGNPLGAVSPSATERVLSPGRDIARLQSVDEAEGTLSISGDTTQNNTQNNTPKGLVIFSISSLSLCHHVISSDPMSPLTPTQARTLAQTHGTHMDHKHTYTAVSLRDRE